MSAFTRASHWLRWVVRGRTGSSAVVQSIVVRILILGTTLFSGVITARNLGPAGRGMQGAMMLWPGLLAGLLTLGVPVGIKYQARKHQGEQASLFSTALVLGLGLGIIAMVIGIVGIPHWIAKYDEQSIRFAQYLMIFAPLTLLMFILSAILEVNFDFTSSNALRYAPALLVLIGLLALVVLHRFTPYDTAFVYTFAFVPPAVVLALRIRKTFTFTLRDFKRSSRRLLSYGARIYISDVLTIFGAQIDQLLVVGLLSATNLGTYTVALTASRILNVFQNSVTLVLLPKASGLAHREVASMVGRAARVTTALTLVSGVPLIAALPLILPFLYGKEFIAAIRIAQILTLESIIASATIVHVQTFMATNRPGMSAILQLMGLALAVPLMLLLIPRLGLAGAAFALLASTVARFIVVLVSYPLLLKLAPPALILNKDDIAYLRDVLRQRNAGPNHA